MAILAATSLSRHKAERAELVTLFCIDMKKAPWFQEVTSSLSRPEAERAEQVTLTIQRGMKKAPWFQVVTQLTLPQSPRAHLQVVWMLGFVSFDINQSSLPTQFYSALGVCFCLYFQLYFVPQILPTTLRFLTLFFRSYFCLIIPFNNTHLSF